MRKNVEDYFWILVGSFLIAVGVNWFLLPHKIAAGGASGIGTILYVILGIPISVTALIINVSLLIAGYKSLSKSSFLKALFGMLGLSLFLEITSIVQPFSNDVLLSSIYGGVVVGIGVGLAVSRNASTGGTDFAAVLLNKLYPRFSVAVYILIIDAIIIVASSLAFEDYSVILYATLSLYITTRIADDIIEGVDFAKSIYIISDKCDEISKCIMSDLDRGVTGIYIRKMYSENDGMMLMCIIRKNQFLKLKKIVKQIDDNAFIILTDVREVLGEGFKK